MRKRPLSAEIWSFSYYCGTIKVSMAFDFEQGNDPVIEQQKATLARKIKDALAKLAQLLKGKR